VDPSDAPALRIIEEADGTTAVLRLVGELDVATADLLRGRVRALSTASSEVRRLTVDLGELEFLDVTGVGALLEARRRMAELGGSVFLSRPRPIVRRMLSLLNLEDVLHVDD